MTTPAERMREIRDREAASQLEMLLGLPEQPGKPVERTCVNCGERFTTRVRDRDRCSALCRQPLNLVSYVNCVICGKLFTARWARERKTCGHADCQREYMLARVRRREHLRRTAISDVTPEQELEMRRKARKCPLCDVRLTDKVGLPNSKHLDHILPICMGGTHTWGNLRVLCARCNLGRPKDGSDFAGQLTLWAQGPAPVSRPKRSVNQETCKNGLHPWIPENIAVIDGNQRCRPCHAASRSRREKKRYPQKACKCGALFAAPGATFMCPACTDVAARTGADLHASGLTWAQVAAQVGYGTAEGARYAAERVGYKPRPKPAQPKPPRLCPDCGTPKLDGAVTCRACTEAKAWQAVGMRRQGMTLEEIGARLGYTSKTSVTNLLKTVVTVEPYARDVTLSDDQAKMLTTSSVHVA